VEAGAGKSKLRTEANTMSGRLPDEGTTRRIISDFFIKHRSLIMPHVLEVGSARPADAWWADLRSQLGGISKKEWTGVDMKASDGTDVVRNLARLDFTLHPLPQDSFGSCVCAETLEHVDYPAIFLMNVFNLLRPGAWIVITTPFAFPVHESTGKDYWRFTPSGLHLLLTDAGFEQAHTYELEPSTFYWHDHEHKLSDYHGPRDLPFWIGAIARKPE